MNFITANNAASVLAESITASATTLIVSLGTGALFPQPVVGDTYFVLTLSDKSGAIREIVWVTNRQGDIFTISRAKEGTTPLSWKKKSNAQNLWTSEQVSVLLRIGQAVSFTPLFDDLIKFNSLTVAIAGISNPNNLNAGTFNYVAGSNLPLVRGMIAAAVGGQYIREYGDTMYPAWTETPLNGTSDASVGLQASYDFAANYGLGKINGQGFLYLLISAALRYWSTERIVKLENIILDSANVALTEDVTYDSYTAIVVKGSLSNVQNALTQDGRQGLAAIVIGDTPTFAVGDRVLIGMSPPLTTLVSDINETTTTIVVANATGMNPTGFLLIESERIAYNSISGNTITVVPSIGRGIFGTIPAVHVSGTLVSEWHPAKWHHSIDNNRIRRSEVKQVAEITPYGDGHSYVISFDQTLDQTYSASVGAWLRKGNYVKAPILGDDVIIQCSPPNVLRGAPLYETCIYAEYADGLNINGATLKWATGMAVLMTGSINGNVSNSVIHGKVQSVANQESIPALYGIAVLDSCQWLTVVGNRTYNCAKLITFLAGTASFGTLTYFGEPNDVAVTGNIHDNSGAIWVSENHQAYEVHGAGRNITFTGNIGINAFSLLRVQGGTRIKWDGGSMGGWDHNVLSLQGFYLDDIEISNITVGPRSLGGGYTFLTDDIDDIATDISVFNGYSINDIASGGFGRMVKIDDEIILVFKMNDNFTELQSCTRGYNGTIAVPHAANAPVTGFGYSAAAVLDCDFRAMVWLPPSPDARATYLTAGVSNSVNTFPVNDLSVFPTPGAFALEAQVQGADGTRNYEPEIISYTGKSAANGPGNLTGVVRGLMGTTATSHVQYIQVMPFKNAAVRSVRISDTTIDTAVNSPQLNLIGFTPAQNCRATNTEITWTGKNRPITYVGVVQPSGFLIDEYATTDASFGIRLSGRKTELQGMHSVMNVDDPSGGSSVLIDADNCTVRDSDFDQSTICISVTSSPLNTLIEGNEFRSVTSSSRPINNLAGANTTARNNALIGFPLTAAIIDGTLTLPMIGDVAYTVTGNGNLATIPAQADGVTVPLIFLGTPTLINAGSSGGNNLYLNGAANRLVTINTASSFTCIGGKWYEN